MKEKEIKDDLNELVDFYAFKDDDRYRDDIVVTVNGKNWQINTSSHKDNL